MLFTGRANYFMLKLTPALQIALLQHEKRELYIKMISYPCEINAQGD